MFSPAAATRSRSSRQRWEEAHARDPDPFAPIITRSGLLDLKARRAWLGEALKGVFTGNTDEIEKRVEAEASKIKASALKLCDKLPAMMASQQQLKTSLPEFAPYATMTQDDIKDCRDEVVEREGSKRENFAAKAAAEPSREPVKQ